MSKARKFTNEQVLEMIEKYKNARAVDVAKEYGCCVDMVIRIARCERYKNVEREPFYKGRGGDKGCSRKGKLSFEDRRNIVAEYKTGLYTKRELNIKYGLNIDSPVIAYWIKRV